jgi:serine/threonine protein kinase
MEELLQVGPYRIVRRIAVGGMGEIFLAEVEGPYFARQVVLKRMLPQLTQDTQHVNRFIDEARLMTQLHHGNILSVYELKQDEWGLYMVMEYIPSVDIRTINLWMHQQGETWPSIYAAWVIAEICEGLSYAHNRQDQQGQDLQIIHRDISPSNLLLGLAGEVKLIDFGVAQAQGSLHQSVAGTLQGKLNYLSPEQARGDKATPQSDLYALGLILYEMLSGVRALEGVSDADVLYKAQIANLIPLTQRAQEQSIAIASDLCRIVDQSLQVTLQDRTPNASVLAHQLKTWIQQQQHTQNSNQDQPAMLIQHELHTWISELQNDQKTRPLTPAPLDINQALQAQIPATPSDPQISSSSISTISLGSTHENTRTASVIVTPPIRFNESSISLQDLSSAIGNESKSQISSEIQSSQLSSEMRASSTSLGVDHSNASFDQIWTKHLDDHHNMVDPSTVQIDLSLHVDAASLYSLASEISNDDLALIESELERATPAVLRSNQDATTHLKIPTRTSRLRKLQHIYLIIIMGILISAFFWSYLTRQELPLALLFYDEKSEIIEVDDLQILIDQKQWSWHKIWSNDSPLQICIQNQIYDLCQWVSMKQTPLVQDLPSSEQAHIWQRQHWEKSDYYTTYTLSKIHVAQITLKPQSSWLKSLQPVSSNTIKLTGNDYKPKTVDKLISSKSTTADATHIKKTIPFTQSTKNIAKSTSEIHVNSKNKSIHKTLTKINHPTMPMLHKKSKKSNSSSMFIHITATPNHAKLYCKGLTIQTLPYRLKKSLQHQCYIKAKGYQPHKIRSKSPHRQYHVNLSAWSTVTLRALPRSAELYIDQRLVTNPIKNHQIIAGEHTVSAKIMYKGHLKSKEIKLNLQAKQKLTKVIDLSELLYEN